MTYGIGAPEPGLNYDTINLQLHIITLLTVRE